MTQQQAAEVLGVDQKTISRDLGRNTVMTPKVSKPQRKRIIYQISQYTKPETAAQKIRDKFGDDFAAELKVNL